MKTITLHTKSGNSLIVVGESIENLKNYLPDKQIIIVTDTNLNRLYGKAFSRFPIIELDTGEKIKTLHTLEFVFSSLLDLGADRHSFLVGVGGGVVCDITGFAASIFMRGIDFGFVSTSLLSQVDASVGGKNGVNFHSYKNIIGSFNQPLFVICDTGLLKTLPQKEIRCGLCEIIKHSLIADRQMFTEIKDTYQDIFRFNKEFLTDLVYRNVQIKANIVNRDEKESGERKKLNFGHTLGHAIEKLTGMSHGESVIAGIRFAAWWSEKQSLLSEQEFLLIKQGLNKFKDVSQLEISPRELFDAVQKDKKRNQEKIDFVFLREIGKTEIKSISMNELKEAINDFF